MRKSLAAVFTAVAVAATALAGGIAPASALVPGVAFAASDLPTWQTNGIVWAMAESNGIIYAGGTFTAIRPPGTAAGDAGARPAVNFAAFDAYTGEPVDCNLSVTGTSATVRALEVSPDGSTLYVGGSFGAINGIYTTRIAAINIPSCTVNTNFKPGVVSSTIRAIDSTPDAVYFGGDFKTVRDNPRNRLAAVTHTGALLPWAPAADLPIRAIHAPGGANVVIAGGDFKTMNGADSKSLAVLDRGAGANVRAYPNFFIPASSVVKTITSDAHSFYIGNEGTGGGVFDGRARFDLTSFNQVWRDTCLGATQAVSVYQEKLYAAHHVHDCGNMGSFTDGSRIYLSAQNLDNPSPMLQWNPMLNDGIGEKIGPRALAHTSTGSNDVLWVGGEFEKVNGLRQQGLTRFGPGPGAAGPTAPRFPSVESTGAGQNTVRWQTSTDPDDSELTYSVYRNNSSTPLGTVQASSRWWELPQASFTDTTAVPGTTYTYRVRASDSDGHTGPLSAEVRITTATAATASAYANAVRADGAETYWRLGDSFAAAADSSPANRMGLPYGGPAHAGMDGALAADSNKATAFDGVDDFIYGPQRTAAPSVYSAEVWFRTDTTAGGKIFGFGNGQPSRNGKSAGQSSSYDRHLYMTNAGNLIFGTWTGQARTVTSPGTYNDGVWHHAVATQGPGGTVLYVDGERVAVSNTTGNEAMTGSWRIGGDNLSTSWPQMPRSRYFKGSIDEFAVYPTALSAASVQAHYQAGTGTTPPPEPDTAPPSAVEGVTAAAAGTTVNLGWNAATDNVEVSAYQVHRSDADEFTPSGSTLLATVPAAALSYEDKDLVPGTWHYRVLAVDAAGNTGPASAQASAMMAPAAPEPVTLTLLPAEDTYVNQGAPNAAYGSSVTMASRGSLGYVSYLRFLPGSGVPEGMTLQSATLRLQTTAESFAGSVDPHTVHAVTGPWAETAATWNTRPALAAPLLGTIAPVVLNTVYTVDLDPAAVSAMLAGPVDLGITSASTDNAWFYTKEASAVRRPVLTLVFAP